jgi:predicted nucleotidyltransferase
VTTAVFIAPALGGNSLGIKCQHADKRSNRHKVARTLWYRGADVPLSVIRRFARAVAARFRPEKIILFGSYVYGQPHADSDVDILVVVPARNQIDQAVRINVAIDPPFPLDIIVRTPCNLNWRLKEGDSFLREIVSQGKVLYEKAHGRVAAKGRLPAGRKARPRA